MKANASSLGTGAAGDKNSEGWLYCLKKGQARTSKLPNFDWTGYYANTCLFLATLLFTIAALPYCTLSKS